MVLSLYYTHGATVTPPPSVPEGTPGAVIRARRTQIGKRQEDLANDAEVSQKLISEIERGEQDLLSAGIGRVRNIARALEWSLNELQEQTGLDLGIELSHPTDAERRGYKLPPEPAVEIPELLREAARLYGKGQHAPMKEERWLRELASLDFREEPETPEDWLAIYVRLSKLIKPR